MMRERPAMSASDAKDEVAAPIVPPRLGLWDAVSIIVGIVVGTAIFRATAGVFANAGGPWATMGLWLAGGVLTLCGALTTRSWRRRIRAMAVTMSICGARLGRGADFCLRGCS